MKFDANVGCLFFCVVRTVLPFCLRNSILPEKVCGNFGAHWITAEKSCDNGKRSVFRSAEESSKKRSEDPVQVDDTVCRNQKSGQNHKWKQCWKNCLKPEKKSFACSKKYFLRAQEHDEEKKNDSKTCSFTFHSMTSCECPNRFSVIIHMGENCFLCPILLEIRK